MKNTELKSNRIYSLEEINDVAKNNPDKLMARSEEYYHNEISKAVEEILNRPDSRVIMLSGPSSSGKTTTSNMLCQKLAEHGKPAVIISLDDFFLAADKTPFDEHGNRDFEGTAALDFATMKNCFDSLAELGECFMPRFDFTVRRPSETKRHIVMQPGGYLIIEGLHAINPILTSQIYKGKVIKIFLDVQSSVKIDGKILTGRTLRMMRRFVRDIQFRSIDVCWNFDLWQGVVRGEQKNIVPYIKHSDITIDSFHKSELGIIGSRLVPMLAAVPTSSVHYGKASRLAQLLSKIHSIDSSKLKSDSLLTEFIGNSSYDY